MVETAKTIARWTQHRCHGEEDGGRGKVEGEVGGDRPGSPRHNYTVPYCSASYWSLTTERAQKMVRWVLVYDVRLTRKS